MTGLTVQQMAERVADLLEDRLRLRGASLSDKLRRGGRALPRKVRKAATILADAAQKAAVPRLQLQLDHKRIAEAYDICLKHLRPIGTKERRIAFAWSLLTSTALAVFVAVAIVIGALVWRGQV